MKAEIAYAAAMEDALVAAEAAKEDAAEIAQSRAVEWGKAEVVSEQDANMKAAAEDVRADVRRHVMCVVGHLQPRYRP